MRNYDYMEEMKQDVLDVLSNYKAELEECEGFEEVEEKLNELLWLDDSVTGNASGSYTFNTYKAEENLCHNLDLLKEATEEFGAGVDIMESPESCDVTIRCYLLSTVISELELDIIEELEK